MRESNSERLVNTKRNMDTVPRLPIHPFNLPRQLKNIAIIKIKTVMFLYFTKTNTHKYNFCIKFYSSEV